MADSDKRFKFFVDMKEHVTEHSTLTGAQMKAIAGVNPTFGLFEEEHGHQQDKQILDDTSVNLDTDRGPLRFYSVPPATFGR